MSALRKLKAYVLGHNTDMQSIGAELEEACIPVSTEECRGCADPCDQGHEEYPSRFDVDMETQMLGSVKPYHRQVLISTGKSDWPHDVASEDGSLAAYLSGAISAAPKAAPVPNVLPAATAPADSDKTVPGVFSTSATGKITVLNGSHHSVCDDPARETVLVLPDYKVVSEVERSLAGAEQLYKDAVDPAVGRVGAVVEGSPVRSWVLPYSTVVLLCSHKKRDNRCAIAAPKLEHGLTAALERAGWDVHTQLEDPSTYGPPLEDLAGTAEEKDAELLRQLRAHDAQTAETKRALILRCSHVGGHKFAGNCIIYTPQGSAVWYGRVTPHEVEAIVRDTIIGGKIIPTLLRGGLNLSRLGAKSLNDW